LRDRLAQSSSVPPDGACRPQVFTVAAPLGGLFRRSASTD